MKKFNMLIFFYLLIVSSLFAQEATDTFNVKTWMPKFIFKNTSEFRYDIDTVVPGIENSTDVQIKFKPFVENPELGKNREISGYIKIEDIILKTVMVKDLKLNTSDSTKNSNRLFQLELGDITAQINIYAFYMKISKYPDFKFNEESLILSAPISTITSKYYGKPSDGSENILERKTIIARSASVVGGFSLGYKSNYLDWIFSLGAAGSGDRNESNFNFPQKGILLGTQFKIKPIEAISLNLAVTAAAGNYDSFLTRPMIYHQKDTGAVANDDIYRSTLSNGAILSSIGMSYKIPLGTINDRNTHLVFSGGADIAVDPFASDFSTFGYITKKANTSDGKLDLISNALNFSQQNKTSIAYAVGAGITFAWNTKTGKDESWEIKGKDSYDTKVFGEQDKKSGVTLFSNFGQNLYASHDNTNNKLKDIAENSFTSLNTSLSTYEDNKEGIIPNLGWIFSIGVYDLFRNIPNVDNPIENPDELKTSSFQSAIKFGTAIFLDYALPLQSISEEAFLIPYIGAYFFKGISSNNLYFKTGIKLEKLIKLTSFSIGWDSNDLLAAKDTIGSVFIQCEIKFDNTD